MIHTTKPEKVSLINFAEKNEGKDCLFSFLSSSAPYLDSAANLLHSEQNCQKKCFVGLTYLTQPNFN